MKICLSTLFSASRRKIPCGNASFMRGSHRAHQLKWGLSASSIL